jgi:hypothetical protein
MLFDSQAQKLTSLAVNNYNKPKSNNVCILLSGMLLDSSLQYSLSWMRLKLTTKWSDRDVNKRKHVFCFISKIYPS